MTVPTSPVSRNTRMMINQILLTPPPRSRIANLHGENDLAWAPGRGAQQPGLCVVLVQQLHSVSHRHVPEAGVEDGTLHEAVPILAALLGSLQTGQGEALQKRDSSSAARCYNAATRQIGREADCRQCGTALSDLELCSGRPPA